MNTIPLGVDIETGLPHLERASDLTSNNSICLAPTGFGKTSLWFAKLLRHFLREDAVLVIFDGAQDPFVYHLVHAFARAAGRKVRVLFDSNRFQSERLDPFHPYRTVNILPDDLRDQVFNSASIYYTKMYGPGWYGLASLKAAHDGAHAVIRQRLPVSLPSVIEKMTELARHSRDAEQILYSLIIATSHDAIVSVDEGAETFIRWDEAEKNREVVLVSWDATRVASSFFGTTIHQSLVTHAHLATALGKNRVQKIIMADEWPSLLSLNYAQSLAMERKHKLSHHLLNQTRFQLDVVDENLAKIILGQCQYEMHFSMDLETQEYVQSFSKMTEATLKGRTVSSHGLALSEREFMDRVLEINQLLEISSTFGAGVLVRRIQRGFHEPFKLFFEHEISEDVFLHLSSLPLPLKPEPPKPALPAPRGWRHAPHDADWNAREAALQALFGRRAEWASGQ